ncbi:hypothetical protein V6Z12_D13G030300 [Gossypium hirsutum]
MQIMVIKSSFSVILCCSLLASVFFLYEISSRKLMVVPDGKGWSKARVNRSPSKQAPSWVGYKVPPPSTGSVEMTSLLTSLTSMKYNG